jgi:hypothetical protein
VQDHILMHYQIGLMDAYDSNDARPRSPLLEPQTIRYKLSESPPPFLPEKCSSFSPKDTTLPLVRLDCCSRMRVEDEGRG